MRAISRVATAESEDGWVSAALGATAAQLDRLVAACERVTRADSEHRVGRERVSWRYDEHGMLVVSARLAPERGARLLAALEQEQHAAAEHHRGDGVPGDESPAETVAPCGQSSAKTTGTCGQSSAEDHAADSEQAHEHDENDDEVHPRPGRTLPDALVGLAETALAHGPRPVEAGDIHQVVIHVDDGALAATSAATGPTGGSLNGGVCHLHDGPALHPDTLRRETCAGATTCTVTNGVDGTPMDVGRATRRVPARLRRAVTDRAGGRCQYPGCRRKAWLQIHHVRHWLDGGPTAYANLALLCSRHHRAHHTGRYHITHDTRAAGHFRFHLADGTPIPHVPEPPTLVGALADQHSAPIAPETIQPDWHDRLDLDYAVSVLTRGQAA